MRGEALPHGVWRSHHPCLNHRPICTAKGDRQLSTADGDLLSAVPDPAAGRVHPRTEQNAERVAVTIYVLILFDAALLSDALWWYAVARRLVHPCADDADVWLLSPPAHPRPGRLYPARHERRIDSGLTV